MKLRRLLLLLLLKLLLELGRNRRHWRGARCLELLRLSLSRKPGILLLQWLLLRLVSRLLGLQRISSVLLLQWLLSEARGLRRKGARLLTRLLARPKTTKGAAILLLSSPRARTVAS